MGIIYKITNTINNKCYIGITKRTLKRRWYEHRWSAKNNKKKLPVHNAINKYGEDNFSIEVIEKCDNDILDEKEIYYIKFFDSIKNGYNLAHGGFPFSAGESHISKNKKKTKEHREKISNAHKGKKCKYITGILARDFKVWYYLKDNTLYVCDRITKTDWCKKHDVGRWLIKENIRKGSPIIKGRFKGYQFFNVIPKKLNTNDLDIVYFGGGLINSYKGGKK